MKSCFAWWISTSNKENILFKNYITLSLSFSILFLMNSLHILCHCQFKFNMQGIGLNTHSLMDSVQKINGLCILWHTLANLVFRFGLTAIYLLAIQYFTKIGGKVSVKLIKYENNDSTEYRANSLVYKVMSKNYFMPFYFCSPHWVISLRNYLLSLPGIWSIFYAVIYRALLSYPFTS